MYNLGALYVGDTSQYDKAEQWFKKTLEVTSDYVIRKDIVLLSTGLNPSHENAAYILGAIHSERNDCNIAVSYLSQVMRENRITNLE